jgi:RNase H-like domain found in reverse transcriptase
MLNLMLSFPNSSNQFVLKTDALGKAVGAALYQLRKDKVANCLADVGPLNLSDSEDAELITFYSQILTTAEANYLGIQLKFFGVVKALEALKWLLLEIKLYVLVLVDHCNLEQLIQYKPKKRRHMKWLDIVAGFNIKIAYLPGSENVVVDARTRPPGVRKLKLNLAEKLITEAILLKGTTCSVDAKEKAKVLHCSNDCAPWYQGNF